MKYFVTHLPNSEKSLKFKVRDAQNKNQAYFDLSKSVVEVWGKPDESALKQLMVAHIKKNGWQKAPVVMDEKNSPQNLKTYISSLAKK